MKRAEALIERADIQKKNAQLLNRVNLNTMAQEGDAPAENPQELVVEYEENMARCHSLKHLAKQLNVRQRRTNNIPMRPLGWLSPDDRLRQDDYLGRQYA